MFVPVLENLLRVSFYHASWPGIRRIGLLVGSIVASTAFLTPNALPPSSVLLNKLQSTPIRCEHGHLQVIFPVVHAVESSNLALLLDSGVVVVAEENREHLETEALNLRPALLQVILAVHDEELVRVLILLVEVAFLFGTGFQVGSTRWSAKLFAAGAQARGVCVIACTESRMG